MKISRNESQIFEDLLALSCSPGYVHAIAYMCVRDNLIIFKNKLEPSDTDKFYDSERLIRTEFMTLLGLMVKETLDLSPQPNVVIDGYVKSTDALMHELHEMMYNSGGSPNLCNSNMVREAILYGPESAYFFQYIDFVPDKFGADDIWLKKHKGFTSSQAQIIAKTMCRLLDEKGGILFDDIEKNKASFESPLRSFELSLDEVVLRSGIERNIVQSFFDAFLFSGKNERFNSVGDFNEVAARPLIPTGRGTVLLFSPYAISEALYESPFFWMLDDKDYRPTALKHRGAFPEKFAASRLSKVFRDKHVHTNVNLYRGKNVVAEVDVLVIYGDRLIILQAKSKKLTIAARKGNVKELEADFSKAIQDSYDQGWKCGNELLAGGCRLVDDRENAIDIPANVKEIFLFCLVSEHYPALALQANQLLKIQTSSFIHPPFVMDVFFLDALTEMLVSPLHFLNFVKLRLVAGSKLLIAHELNALGFYLKEGILHDTRCWIYDSCTRDLETAMIIRRENLPGNDTPEGILTKMRGTLYEKLINEIENRSDSATLNLGFYLLSLSDASCKTVENILKKITHEARNDGKRHTVTIMPDGLSCGITFHCNPRQSDEAFFNAMCQMRKYNQHADYWFGISVGLNGEAQFGVNLDFPWKQSDEMDRHTANMQPIRSFHPV